MAASSCQTLRVTKLSTFPAEGAGICDMWPAPGLDALLVLLSESDSGFRYLQLMPLTGDSPSQVIELPDAEFHGGIDGMCVSSSGRVYLAYSNANKVLSFKLEVDDESKEVVACDVDILSLQMKNMQVGPGVVQHRDCMHSVMLLCMLNGGAETLDSSPCCAPGEPTTSCMCTATQCNITAVISDGVCAVVLSSLGSRMCITRFAHVHNVYAGTLLDRPRWMPILATY